MKTLLLLTLSLFSILTFAAEPLPIKHGIYVLHGSPCSENPASAFVIGYYGDHLGVGHDGCSFLKVRTRGRSIRAQMSCSQHGSDTSNMTILNAFVVVDRENFVIGSQLGDAHSKLDYQLYTWCRASLN